MGRLRFTKGVVWSPFIKSKLTLLWKTGHSPLNPELPFMARPLAMESAEDRRKEMKKNGFSLIELLISSTLILFLITGTAQLLGCRSRPRGARIPFPGRPADFVTAGISQSHPMKGPTSRRSHEEVLVDPSSMTNTGSPGASKIWTKT